MRFPFDGLALACSLHELRAWQGSKVQKVVPVGKEGLAVQLFLNGAVWVWVNWGTRFPRLVLSKKGPPRAPENQLSIELERRLMGAQLVGARQLGSDRCAEVLFAGENEKWNLVVELFGRHANVVLCSREGAVRAAARTQKPEESTRPIRIGQAYPALLPSERVAIQNANEQTSPEEIEGVSGVLARAMRSGLPFEVVRAAFVEGKFAPVLSAEHGAYPLPLPGWEAESVESFGAAAAEWLAGREEREAVEQLRQRLVAQLQRALGSRRHAAEALQGVLNTAEAARQLQMKGELILAYGSMHVPGAKTLDVWDYEGNPQALPFDPEKTAAENANKWFDKAKRAKEAVPEAREQARRMQEEAKDIEALLSQVQHYETLAELAKTEASAKAMGVLRVQISPSAKAADKPFQGKKIRELAAPAGYRVLYGENAEANDYLTLRLAQPSDFWLHVRGDVGAHVIIRTLKKPDQVPHEVLLYAAQVAARNSNQKHSSLVAVDCTLKRYVRRVKGGALGLVQYTHERTLHVEPNWNG